MANNHGASLPRPHRPRAPIMTTPPPITAHLNPLWPSSSVSLIHPRPECDRITNEYVETPFRLKQQSPQSLGHNISSFSAPATQSLSPSIGGLRPIRQPSLVPNIVVTKQPPTSSSASSKVDPQHHGHLPQRFHQNSPVDLNNSSAIVSPRSIVCQECGRCRCHSCQQPRRLPHKWMCNNFCLCSADAIIDYTTCLCCVKAFMYHCCYEADNEEESCPDDPCSCAPDEMRTGRWTCLATMAFCLPCLWLYWPLQCGKRAVEACYARHFRKGCRCQSRVQPALDVDLTGSGHINTDTVYPALRTINNVKMAIEKRLLDSSPEF